VVRQRQKSVEELEAPRRAGDARPAVDVPEVQSRKAFAGLPKIVAASRSDQEAVPIRPLAEGSERGVEARIIGGSRPTLGKHRLRSACRGRSAPGQQALTGLVRSRRISWRSTSARRQNHSRASESEPRRRAIIRAMRRPPTTWRLKKCWTHLALASTPKCLHMA